GKDYPVPKYDDTSRMTGDRHVRFCERLAGETPACLLGVRIRKTNTENLCQAEILWRNGNSQLNSFPLFPPSLLAPSLNSFIPISFPTLLQIFTTLVLFLKASVCLSCCVHLPARRQPLKIMCS